jgi:penicillin-binding protein-related factor A (putative recombinase)
MSKSKDKRKVGYESIGHEPLATEKDIERAILDFLAIVPHGKFWKNNTVGIFDPSTQSWRKLTGRHHARGAADILGVVQGRFVAIEVKKGRNRTSKEQDKFLDDILAAGGIAFVARSIPEVIENLRKFGVFS